MFVEKNIKPDIFDPELFKAGTKVRCRCCNSECYSNHMNCIVFKQRDYETIIFQNHGDYLVIPLENNPEIFSYVYVNTIKNKEWIIEII